MNCHQHTSKAATAVCRACGRAVCAECMQFSDYREAVCSDVCNQERERAHAMRAALTVEIDSRVRAYRIEASLYRSLSVIAFLVAAFVSVEGYLTHGGVLPTRVAVFFVVILVMVAIVAELAARHTIRRSEDARAIANRLEQ